MTQYLKHFYRSYEEREGPLRGTHLTSIPLLSGGLKAEGHTATERGRERRKKESKETKGKKQAI